MRISTVVEPFSKNKSMASVRLGWGPPHATPSIFLRLPPLKMPFDASVYEDGRGGVSNATIPLSFEDATSNKAVYQAFIWFKALDDHIENHLVAHRDTLFPGLKHLSEGELKGRYARVTKVTVASNGKKYPPTLRVKIPKAKAFAIKEDEKELASNIQDFLKPEDLQMKGKYMGAMVDVTRLVLRNNGANISLTIDLTYGSVFSPEDIFHYTAMRMHSLDPSTVWGEEDVLSRQGAQKALDFSQLAQAFM